MLAYRFVTAASRGSAPSNRIWNNTTLRSPKQQIWLKTALCEGWCRRMALRNRELHARNDDDDSTWHLKVIILYSFSNFYQIWYAG